MSACRHAISGMGLELEASDTMRVCMDWASHCLIGDYL
jgi:hypothetical protein